MDSNSESFLECWPQLRRWFRRGARDLPWRKEPVDPYKIWISEVMSQQSTMATVVPFFNKWIQHFPTIYKLAEATEDEVLSLWAGLGYYSRARNVRLAALEIVAGRADGRWEEWPEDLGQWLSLKGVGPYTAAAVLSIGLGRKALPADGNVYRVGARFFGVEDPLNSSSDRKQIEALLEAALRSRKVRDASVFSQSLMELGALVCRPGTQALCEVCPLAAGCVSRGTMSEGVPKPKKRRAMIEVFELLDLSTWDGKFVVIPEGARLAGQWEFPRTELTKMEFERLQPQLDFEIRHSITHHKYRVGVMGAGCPGQVPKPEGQVLTTLTRKILNKWESLDA